MTSEPLWALVLAAGEGSRIRHLTTDASGRSIPKQYVAFDGKASLLRKTLDRAERIVPRERVAVVVAGHHREFWARELMDLPPRNVIEQPRNRGTGVGLLLGVLHLWLRDPGCEVLVLPSDHHVADEDALQQSLLQTVEHARQAGGRPTLLGVTPERTEADLGWILSAEGHDSEVRDVAGFVEKPKLAVARDLVSHGALVNSMILAAGAGALLSLFESTLPDTVGRLVENLTKSEGRPTTALDALYDALPTRDFSRDVLESMAKRLAVVAARPCGWTDIGTPDRLGRVFMSHPGATFMAS